MDDEDCIRITEGALDCATFASTGHDPSEGWVVEKHLPDRC